MTGNYRLLIFLLLSLNLQAMDIFTDRTLLKNYFDSEDLVGVNNIIDFRDSYSIVRLQKEINILKLSDRNNQNSVDLLSAEIYSFLASKADTLSEAEDLESIFRDHLNKLALIKHELNLYQLEWFNCLEARGLPITHIDDPRIENMIPFQ